MNSGTVFEKRPGIALNPYLPEFEYIPDGEPHVFGDRVYVYGSHDRFRDRIFCTGDYLCYSASIQNLTKWRFEGVIYTNTQDPRMADGTHMLWAPDVVKGKDGKYYLYYCPDASITSIGVAVCDSPAGKYEFLGIVQDKEGGYLGERPGDTYAFDPGVFLDEDGEIYLYTGNGPRFPEDIGKEPKGSVVVKLCDDMLTMKTEPAKLLPTLEASEGTGFEGHEFFEASSIRKIGNLYYFVYSPVTLHQLCYAVSEYPDRNYRYGGVLISNAELFEEDENSVILNCWGNNHGSIEKIGGDYCIFYHVPVNRTVFSRQGRAEKIRILPDGSIPQVHMTSQGLQVGPLPAAGTYPASCVCLLYDTLPQDGADPFQKGDHAFVTQDGDDFAVESMPQDAIPPRQYIANGKNGMTAGFRYFAFQGPAKLSVTVRGTMQGALLVRTSCSGPDCGRIAVSPCAEWTKFEAEIDFAAGVQELYFVFEGSGVLEMLGFTL